jgi:iron complex transport system ATP-binding protein
VTHHIEEIPAGTTHALLLKDGAVVAQGEIDKVISNEHLSYAYGLPITVDSVSGRYFARAN